MDVQTDNRNSWSKQKVFKSVLCFLLTTACTQVIARTIGSIPLNLLQLSERYYILATAFRTALHYLNFWDICKVLVWLWIIFQNLLLRNLMIRTIWKYYFEGKSINWKIWSQNKNYRVRCIYIQEIHYEKVYEAINQRTVS